MKSFLERFRIITRFIHSLYPKKENTNTMNTTTTPVVLLRPRRASENRRRTQIQLPLALACSNFFFDVHAIVNCWGDRHPLVNAHARGRLNTVKVEIPELAYISDPVIRLTKKENGDILYEAFNADSITGSSIFDTLRLGLSSKQTRVTLPRQQDRATWYRQVA